MQGEEVVYKWKFRLDENFQVSPSFTHVHQLKSVGGSLASMPMYTITLRKGNPDRLELRYAETNSQITLKQTNLAPLKGVWLDVTERITYGKSGAYSIEIKNNFSDTLLFNYSNNSIVNWRENAEFVRPKWGIYRSLNSSQDLRNEEVLFANFSIEEQGSLSVRNVNKERSLIKIFPNPSNSSLKIEEKKDNSYNVIKIINQLGQIIIVDKKKKKSINISKFPKGIYTVMFLKNNIKVATEKFIVP